MKFFVIGDSDTVLGFRYAGIEGRVVSDADEAAAALREAVARSDIGIVIITEEIAESVRDEVTLIKVKVSRPLLVEVPGPAGPSPTRRTLLSIITEAVGVRV
ncbi:MAG: V-type ATP synthase subunit F [Planctomycetota bacterium]